MRLIYLLFFVLLVWGFIVLYGWLGLSASSENSSMVDNAFKKAGIEGGGSPIEQASRLKKHVEDKYQNLEHLEKEALGEN